MQVIPRKHFLKISTNLEVHSPEFLENLEEMFPMYRQWLMNEAAMTINHMQNIYVGLLSKKTRRLMKTIGKKYLPDLATVNTHIEWWRMWTWNINHYAYSIEGTFLQKFLENVEIMSPKGRLFTCVEIASSL